MLPMMAETTEYRNALVMAYSPVNSVYEDDNIRFEIYNESLYAINKSEKTIFLDLSRCFINHNGISYPLDEDISKKDLDKNVASKFAISTSNSDFISIPPYNGGRQNSTYIASFICPFLGLYSTSGSNFRDFSDYEERFITLINKLVTESKSKDPKGNKYLGTAVAHLTEDESIWTLGATLAYSFSKDSQEWTTTALSTWISDVIFAPYHIDMPEELSKNEKKGFDLKNTISGAKIRVKANSPFEFEKDKSPVILTDWEGDFNKGEFRISPSWIIRMKPFGFWLSAFLQQHVKELAKGNKTKIGITIGDLKTYKPEAFYKRTLIFEGDDSDWGQMKYKSGRYNILNK